MTEDCEDQLEPGLRPGTNPYQKRKYAGLRNCAIIHSTHSTYHLWKCRSTQDPTSIALRSSDSQIPWEDCILLMGGADWFHLYVPYMTKTSLSAVQGVVVAFSLIPETKHKVKIWLTPKCLKSMGLQWHTKFRRRFRKHLEKYIEKWSLHKWRGTLPYRHLT